MASSNKCLIALAVSLTAWGTRAHAQEPEAPADEPAQPAGLSDEDMAKLAEGEAIEIYDERPDKPFDRDTEVRLTGEELAARGAVDLATALALLPDVTVRDAGRGGFNIDIRGARKGAVSILIDGVLVSDPYYGTFDVSTIPITDIVQIRVATTPQSPIDGPGGPGGVIEVHTRDAIGRQVVIGRITADSLPSFGMTGTARVALIPHLALRLSASGLGGARDLDLPGDDTIGEHRYATTGSGRLEYRKGDRRIAADGFIDNRHYISPPSDINRSSILMIDRDRRILLAGAAVLDRSGGLRARGLVGRVGQRHAPRRQIEIGRRRARAHQRGRDVLLAAGIVAVAGRAAVEEQRAPARDLLALRVARRRRGRRRVHARALLRAGRTDREAVHRARAEHQREDDHDHPGPGRAAARPPHRW